MICMKRGKTWAVKEPVNCSPHPLTNPLRQTFHPRLFLKVFSETGWVPAVHLHLPELQGEWQRPKVSIYDWNRLKVNPVALELLSTLEPFTVHSARGHKIVTWAWDVQSRPENIFSNRSHSIYSKRSFTYIIFCPLSTSLHVNDHFCVACRPKLVLGATHSIGSLPWKLLAAAIPCHRNGLGRARI